MSDEEREDEGPVEQPVPESICEDGTTAVPDDPSEASQVVRDWAAYEVIDEAISLLAEGDYDDGAHPLVAEALRLLREARDADQAGRPSQAARSRVLISVSGGCASYAADEGVDVALLDWDEELNGEVVQVPQSHADLWRRLESCEIAQAVEYGDFEYVNPEDEDDENDQA